MLQSKYLRQLLLFLCVLLYAALVNSKPLLVGVISNGPPFAMYDEINHKPIGIGVDIWEETARRLSITDYKYVLLSNNFNQDIIELSQGKYDVLIALSAITKERLKLVEFTEPIAFYPTIVLMKKNRFSLIHLLYFFSTSGFVYLMIGYFLLFFVFSNGLWLLEKGKTLPIKYKEFVNNSIWILFLYGKLDALPKHWGARLLLCVWQVVGYVLLSLLISFGTAVTFELSTYFYHNIKTRADLSTYKIAAEKGSQEEQNAVHAGLNLITVNNIDEAIQLIDNNKLEGIVLGEAEAQYIIQEKHLSNFYIPPVVISRNVAAFAITKNNPLLPEINRTILDLQAEGYTNYYCSKYPYLDSTLCMGN